MSKDNKDKQWVFNKDVEGNSPSTGVLRKVLAYCDSAMIVEHALEPGGEVPMHSHPHVQLTYMVEGRLKLTIGDETQELAKGDTAYIPSGVQHGGICLEKGIALDFFNPMREDFVK